MKSKFYVQRYLGYNEALGMLHYESIKKFNHENEAMQFYGDDKNTREYGTLRLVKTDDNGTYVWDDASSSWE